MMKQNCIFLYKRLKKFKWDERKSCYPNSFLKIFIFIFFLLIAKINDCEKIENKSPLLIAI